MTAAKCGKNGGRTILNRKLAQTLSHYFRLGAALTLATSLSSCASYNLQRKDDAFKKTSTWNLGFYQTKNDGLRPTDLLSVKRTLDSDGTVSTKLLAKFSVEDEFTFFDDSFEYQLLVDGKVLKGDAFSGDDFRDQMILDKVGSGAEDQGALGVLAKDVYVKKLREGSSAEELTAYTQYYTALTDETAYCLLSSETLTLLASAKQVTLRVEGKNLRHDLEFSDQFLTDLRRFLVEAK